MEKHQQVDILAFGAHPDDIEIGVAGVLAKHAAEGYSFAMIDLTLGEMSTNGTVEERQREAARAAEILGASWRGNLLLPDRGIEVNQDSIAKVVAAIRTARPQVVLAPYYDDRHPDHVAASRLVREAFFSAGLAKWEPAWPAFRPAILLYYFLNRPGTPSVIVDVTGYWNKKMASIRAHETQFGREGSETALNTGSFLYFVDSRDRFFGAKIGAGYGEGLVSENPLPAGNLINLSKRGL